MIEDLINRIFFKSVGRYPWLFYLFASGGLLAGVSTLHAGLAQKDRVVCGIAALEFLFFGGALLLFSIKNYRGTWREWCERQEGSLKPGSFWADMPKTPTDCPDCGASIVDRRPRKRTWTQVMWGGWTCPDCGTDVDRFGKAQKKR